MKHRKGIAKMKKTWLKKGQPPFNKGVKEELKVLDTNNGFHYIRPTNSEVVMAKEDPLRPHSSANLDNFNIGGNSTMTLRPIPDSKLEVEKKNSEGLER